MSVASSMKSVLCHQFPAIDIAQYSSVIQTRLTDTIFTRKGIALCSRKFFIYVPRCGCDSNHSYNLLELRKYSAAASRRNGVVGNIGRNIPMIPSAKAILPRIAYINFIYIVI